MITPGFFGLFNAHRGLVATQNAMNTVNHNITNANTPGYSRQRVDLAAFLAYTVPTLHGPNAGQLGQGPTVQQVTRSRDVFLDAQFRLSNGTLGMNVNMKDVLQQIEGIVGEPSTSSVNSAIQDFFDAAQEMSLHPESTAVLQDYIQKSADLVSVFQQQGLQLVDLRRNLMGDAAIPGSLVTSQIGIQTNTVNDKLAAIAKLNQSIVSVKASGMEPNDLMDQRDQLLDELSGLVDIQVTNFDNGQINLTIAGQMMIRGVDQVDSLQVVTNPGPVPSPDDMPALISTVNGGVVLNDGAGPEITSGALAGIIQMGGNDPNFSSIRSILGKLDDLISTMATQVNTLQAGGRDQYGNLTTGVDMFTLDPSINTGQALDLFHWVVNPTIRNDPKRLATAIDDPTAISTGGYAGIGDGRNALAIANLRDQSFGPPLGTGFVDYLNGVVSKLGIDSESYQNATKTQNNLLQTVDSRRQSISGVNMEEEMIDMLRYQRAFEATSKTISMFDDVYKTIINMT